MTAAQPVVIRERGREISARLGSYRIPQKKYPGPTRML